MAARRATRTGPRSSPRAAATDATPRPSRTPWWRASAIVVAAVLVYAASLGYPFVLDDRVTIVENASLRDLGSFRVFAPDREVPSAGRPIVNLSHAINYAIGGAAPYGYRVVNLTLHIVCALLIFALVRLTLRQPRAPRSIGAHADDIALAAALIWALHPMNTEVVEYVTQRSESLMAACLLVTLYASSRALDSTSRGGWQAAAIAACAVGMGCKESMAVAPLGVWLYDRTFVFGSWTAALHRRWRFYLSLAATWLVLAAAIWSGPRIYSAGFSTSVSPWIYLYDQAAMIARYLRLTVWPYGLVVAYGPPLPTTLTAILPQAVLVVALIAATVVAMARVPVVGFAGAWVFLTLAPTSSIVPIATEVGAERRMYVPLAVLSAYAAACAWMTIVRVVSRRQTAVFATATTVIVLSLGVLSYDRTREYESPLRLAQTVLDRWPTSFSHAMVGTELAVAGRHEEAIAELRLAAPGYAFANFHLGGELFNLGRFDEALPALQTFVGLEPWRAEAVGARTMIGRVLMLQQRWREADEELRRVLTMTPPRSERYTLALGLLTDTLFNAQRFDEAAARYREYLEIRPRDVGALINLGVSLAQINRTAEAIAAFQRALEIDPGNASARQNLAIARADGARRPEPSVPIVR
jgi:protein O-mannosyl-transferase